MGSYKVVVVTYKLKSAKLLKIGQIKPISTINTRCVCSQSKMMKGFDQNVLFLAISFWALSQESSGRQTGTIWFDASQTSITSSSSGWNTVTYSQVRKSPNTGDGSPDGISAFTGIFVCAIKGAYKFDFQGEKYSPANGHIRLLRNGTTQKESTNGDRPFLTAILDLVPGDKVYVETRYILYRYSNLPRITFTGFLLLADESGENYQL